MISIQKITIIISSIILCGCVATVPVKAKFPEAPSALLQRCEDLKIIEKNDKVLITDLLKTVVENYASYYICAEKLDAWIEWHKQQKKIFEDIK